ncbi:unnamed protein product [Schistosoma turkestanicum]|nr:unnamed protein product [Schistosoma turkestanicum]
MNIIFRLLSIERIKYELEEALLNAVRQLDRLKKYRISQQTRINQLQERLDHMGHELNSSVDTIRHHRNDYEAQKRRNYMEITDLRKQLAKTSALLGQFKLLFSKADLNNDCWSQNIRVFVGNSLKNLHTTNELQDIDTLSIDDLKLRLSIAENELTQLRSDMAHQREDADREASRLRGQLGEVNSDARTLRMQLNRLISQSKSPSELNGLKNKNSSDSPSCTNCQKLQRLNDILQRKQSKMNMFPDVINRQGNMMNHASIVCENSTFTQKAIHKPHVIDDLVQTDLLDDIPKTDLIQKVDIATDPIDGYNNASPYLPVESCKCIQTESFIVGGDVTLPETPVNGEVSFIGEALQYSIVHEPSMLSEVELNSVPVSDKCTRVSIIGNNNAPPVINDSRNSMLHSVYESKYDNLTSPSQSVSEDLSYSQLLQRLRRAEEEAIMAMDQLKSKRAHLKATISGLDEQVSQ